MQIAEAVCAVLDSIGAAYALIGGRAVGIRGYPRMTLDYAFLTTDKRVLHRETWRSLEDAGVTVDPRKGDFDDPLAGVVHLALAAPKLMSCLRSGSGRRASSVAPSR